MRKILLRVWDKNKEELVDVIMIDFSLNRAIVTNLKETWEVSFADLDFMEVSLGEKVKDDSTDT